tara:strand:- start:254 stop:895 length:642 start_codon:yes stop_codon:yes gene_type:complete
MLIIIKFFLLLLSLSFNSAQSNNKVKRFAFCLEAEGTIFREGLSRNGKLLKGDVIYENDKITVGENSYVSFLNTFERSEVRLFENSSIKILKPNSQFNEPVQVHQIVIFGGKVIIDKIDLNDKALIVKSPSSSVFSKNSHFLIEHRSKPLYDQFSYCIFTLIKGNILVENLDSKKMIFLNSGETIVSTKDGKFYPLETFRDGINVDNAFSEKN